MSPGLSVMVLWACLGANPYLEEARVQFDAVHFREAEAKLELARQVKDSTREERRALFDLLARARLAQGKSDDALAAYAELLAEDPHAPAPEAAAPKVLELFSRAKQRLYPKDYVRLVRAAAAADRLELDLVDPWSQVAQVRLVPGSSLPRAGWHFSAALPDAAEGWRVEALSAQGSVVASLEAPRLTMSPPGPTPALQVAAPVEARPTWPAWVVTGLAVAAAATSAALAVSAASHSRAADQAPFAEQTHALDTQARAQASAAWGAGAGAVALGAGALGLWLWAR